MAWGLQKSGKPLKRRPRSLMKIFLNLCCAASAVCLLTIAASDLGITANVVVVGKSDGGVARRTDGRPAQKPSFAAPVVFNAHSRSKVVQYFDTYRNDPMGLPPGWASGISGKPAGWGNLEFVSGRVIPAGERSSLIGVPVELVRVLAAQSGVDVRYFLAGSSLVAVDPAYRVLDAVRIPTVRLGGEEEIVNKSKLLLMVRREGR